MYYYIVPIIEVNTTRGTLNTPKYIASPPDNVPGIVADIQVIQYGSEPVCILAAAFTPAQHTSFIANSDVIYLTNDLSKNVTGAVETRTKLNNLNIPAAWLINTITWRVAIRRLSVYMGIFQKLAGRKGLRRIFANVTPGTVVPAHISTAIEEIWGIILPDGCTVRDAIELIKDAEVDSTIYLGGAEL